MSAEEINAKYQRELVAAIFRVSSDTNTSSRGANKPAHDPKTQLALNIYSNNFTENGIRALSITFPTVVAFIGDDTFRVLVRRFLSVSAKLSFDWAEYGSELPDFIEQQEALQEYPFLSEVAQLDWCVHQIQRAQDKTFEPTSFALLESGDTDALSFIPAPGLQTWQCWFPVVELHQLIHDPYLQSEEGVLARQELLKNVTKSINNAINTPAPRSLVLWRAEYKAQFDYLSDTEADVINKVAMRSSVNAVIETIGAHNIDLAEWLSNAISTKLIFAVA